MAFAFHLANRTEGIGRLAALRNCKDKRSRLHRWVSIAKFAGIFHFDGDPRELFDQVLAEQRGVPARAARR